VGRGEVRVLRLRLPATVILGAGALEELPRLLRELGVARPLVATDAGVAAAGHTGAVLGQLAGEGFAVAAWDGIVCDPGEGEAERCCERAMAAGSDGIVALGGGSVIDAAKVAAVLATNGGRACDYFGFDRSAQRGLPLVAVPTTPGSGAEVSSHASLVRRRPPRRKQVVAGLHLLPAAALIDPRLAATLPPRETLGSALDSLFHAIEAFVARRATPLTDAFARLAVPEIAAALPRVLAAGAGADASVSEIGARRPPAVATGAAEDEAAAEDEEEDEETAREALARGCLYASFAMANANAGVIHALGYPLAGRYGIPHGISNALMAPAALEHTWIGRPERYGELARLLGGSEAADLGRVVRRLLAAVGCDDSLAGWGVEEAELPRLAREATHFRPVLENTPLALGESDLLAIYRAALGGVGAAWPSAGQKGRAAVSGGSGT
jgi:alcohol dehydrogenase class IV